MCNYLQRVIKENKKKKGKICSENKNTTFDTIKGDMTRETTGALLVLHQYSSVESSTQIGRKVTTYSRK